MASGYLLGLAATLGVVHTASGPDHYVPFMAMARAGHWSLRKTILITTLCGLAHVASSLLIGLVGAWLTDLSLTQVASIDASRETLAAWMLVSFGMLYLVWGVRRALTHRGHHHKAPAGRITPWVLFTIFVFGPCEVLIPLLVVPAAQSGIGSLVGVVTVFTLATITTMLAIVVVGVVGLRRFLDTGWLERYAHAAAGLAMVVCGAGILASLA